MTCPEEEERRQLVPKSLRNADTATEDGRVESRTWRGRVELRKRALAELSDRTALPRQEQTEKSL